MTEEQPERITDVTTPGIPDDAKGTAQGDPIAGVEIDPAEAEQAVEPDDDALEVDGPAQKHA